MTLFSFFLAGTVFFSLKNSARTVLSLLETRALPRAKSQALGKDTLCRGPATGALGKERPSAKRPLPRVRPSTNQIFAEGRGPRQRCPRQIRPVGSRPPFPSSFAEGHPLGPWQRFFFLWNQFFGNVFLKKVFAEGPRPGPRQRFFLTSFSAKFFFINRLCRGPEARPSAKKPFAKGQDRPSAKIFF